MTHLQSPSMTLWGISWRSELGSKKSEIVYYNLQFWLFLRHFWTYPALVIFSPEILLGKLTWLVTLCECLAPFALSRKAFEHLIFSFYRETQNCLEINVNTSIYSFQATWLISTDPYVPSRHPVAFGTRKSPKACIITFNFDCFCDIFGLFRDWSFFSLKIPRSVPTWIVTLRACLTPLALPRKAFEHPICLFLVKSKIASK